MIFNIAFPSSAAAGSTDLYVWMHKAPRPEGGFSSHLHYEDYCRLLFSLELNKELLFPWRSMWPRYEGAEEFIEERKQYEEEVWLSQA